MDVNKKLSSRLSSDLASERVNDSGVNSQYSKMKSELNNSYKPVKKTKSETKEAIASGAAGAFVPPLSSKQETNEKWSEKYKKSIDCNNPKGFSQRAHCQGKKKKSENKESTGASSAGSFAGPIAFKDSEFVRNSFKETPKLTKTETKEATGSASSGSYETPAAWANSTSKKDWRGKSKTQIPGGKFVTVKKKCKKFPYCNQGDINALKIFENETLQRVIKNLSVKHNLSEDIIKSVILTEIKNKL